MFRRLRRLVAVGALGAALLVIGLGSAGSVSAAIDPVAFQKMGCNNGDLTCYYARLYGGYPLRTPFCDNTGCTYAAVGDPYFAGPYFGSPYFGSPYFVNPNVVGVPVGYAVPVYVDPGTAVAIGSTFNGGIITPLNH